MNSNKEMETNMDNTNNPSPETDSPKNGASNTSKKTPHNKVVGHIFSVIAFAFAIASFWTTTKGMQVYIFDGWLGVFVSFGVQAMLFCLSITIPKYWRVLRVWTKTFMLILLAVLITISSGFTYVHAVDHVYGSTKYINSGNSVVQRHSSELKEAKEYVDAAMKYYRLTMTRSITDISDELDLSGTANSNESATPTYMPETTPNAMPTATPIPENSIPAEIATPTPYPSDNPEEDWMPNAIFADDHDYLDTNITVIVVANMDEKGNIIENTIKAMPFDNQPATVAECTEQINEIDLYIEEYESKKNDENKYADNESNQSSGTPRDRIINRHHANAEAYDKVVIKLRQIKSNIELTKDSIEGTIDNKANGLLTEMLKEQNTDNIIWKVNELKDFIMQKQEMLSNDKFARIVDLLQQITITAENYGVLMEIKDNLDRMNIDYSDYLNKVTIKQNEANATATSEDTATDDDTATVTPEGTATAKPTATPEATPTAKPTATPTATPEDDATTTPEATAIATPEPTGTPTPDDWYDYSNSMLAELAAEIRRIPRVEIPDDDNDNDDDDDDNDDDDDKDLLKEINLTKEYFDGYNPIDRADELQDMIRNEIGDINLLEKAFHRLFSENYKTLAWITLFIAFVCDSTALGAGFINNSLAIHNLNPKRATYKAAIQDIKETRKGEARMNRLQLKKNRIKRRHEVRTAVQNKLWDLWKKFLKKIKLYKEDSDKGNDEGRNK